MVKYYYYYIIILIIIQELFSIFPNTRMLNKCIVICGIYCVFMLIDRFLRVIFQLRPYSILFFFILFYSFLFFFILFDTNLIVLKSELLLFSFFSSFFRLFTLNSPYFPSKSSSFLLSVSTVP